MYDQSPRLLPASGGATTASTLRPQVSPQGSPGGCPHVVHTLSGTERAPLSERPRTTRQDAAYGPLSVDPRRPYPNAMQRAGGTPVGVPR